MSLIVRCERRPKVNLLINSENGYNKIMDLFSKQELPCWEEKSGTKSWMQNRRTLFNKWLKHVYITTTLYNNAIRNTL